MIVIPESTGKLQFHEFEGRLAMTRQLSKLQKSILQMAYRNRGSLLARDVLAGVYGFPITVSNVQDTEPGALVFSRRAIGEKRYQSASVSVAKAFNRLAARELAQRRPNEGIVLTEAGIKVAKALS